jgi:hypothetical protein
MSYVQIPGYLGNYVDVPGYTGGFGGVLEDLISIVTPIAAGTVQEGQQLITEKGGELAQQLLNSSQFKKVLKEVEARAYKGAEDAAKKNAIYLMMMAGAGGALGAAVFKGKTGMVAAGALAAFAGWQLTKGGVK